MSGLHKLWVVFRFEWRRSLRLGRFALAAGLAVFPAALLGLMQWHGAQLHRGEAWTVGLFVLVPEIVCLLGLLLWATPAIHQEVEGKTWTYLAVRPGGKAPVLLGKYLAAVCWAVLTGAASLTLAIAIVAPAEKIAHGWAVFLALVVLSCLAYGAIYSLLGVVFLRRGMIAALVYTFFFEFLVGLIPAMVNQWTVQYHLRTLLVRWFGLVTGPARSNSMIGTAPAWQHALVLLCLAAGTLAAASYVLRRRELVSVTEG